MSCNDSKCIDRKEQYPAICTNDGCSHSAFRRLHKLHELVGKVIITSECSSDMLKKIKKWDLRPSLFKVTSWQKAAA